MCFSYACAQNDAAAGGSADGDYYEEGRNSASDSGGSYGMGTPQSSSTAGDYALGSTGEVGIGYDSANGAGNMSGESADALKDPERKEIQSGSVRIVVDEVADAYDKIAALIDSLGGYEFSKSKNNSESDISIYVTVKIPPDKLNDFETGLSDAVGKDAIHQYALSSEDITSQYYDSQTRLETMRISLAKYQEFLGTAQTVEEILSIQREINNLQTEIDVAEGQIRLWDKLVEYATLDVSISSKVTPLQTSWKFDSSSDVFNAIQDGFTSTADGAGNILLWVLVVLVSAVPVLVPLAIVLFILIFLLRKRKKKKLSQKGKMPPVPGTGAVQSASAGVIPTGATPSPAPGQSAPVGPSQGSVAPGSGTGAVQSAPAGVIPTGATPSPASGQNPPAGKPLSDPSKKGS